MDASAESRQSSLPQRTLDRIACRARTLARLFRLGEHDREDIIQDMSLAVLRAMKKYDPSRASPEHFARVVCDFWYACNARRMGLEALRRARTVPWGYPAESEIAEREYEKYTRADAAMDAVDCVLNMPEYQRLAVLMIERLNEVEIARVLGVDRGTIRHWFRQDAKKYRKFRATNGRN